MTKIPGGDLRLLAPFSYGETYLPLYCVFNPLPLLPGHATPNQQ